MRISYRPFASLDEAELYGKCFQVEGDIYDHLRQHERPKGRDLRDRSSLLVLSDKLYVECDRRGLVDMWLHARGDARKLKSWASRFRLPPANGNTKSCCRECGRIGNVGQL